MGFRVILFQGYIGIHLKALKGKLFFKNRLRCVAWLSFAHSALPVGNGWSLDVESGSTNGSFSSFRKFCLVSILSSYPQWGERWGGLSDTFLS